MSTESANLSSSQLADTRQAVGLMLDFAERTGLTSSNPQQRYLWTDAFAVCNFLALERRLNDQHFAALALALVERVHHTLGQHRSDEPRSGWLSGLSGAEAEAHPTAGGLRIGKPLPERLPGQAADAQLEWERDGQYFHYLTKWMHALDQTATRLRRAQLNRWARELAETAHRSFVAHAPGSGGTSMFWKMSIDLSRPLVASMGHHDPLDGWLTSLQLQTSAARFAGPTPGPTLTDAVVDFARMTAQRDLSTTDPLGLGGLLTDAYRARQLLDRGAMLERGLVSRLIWASTRGRDALLVPPEALSSYSALGAQIRSFWSSSEPRRTTTWAEHRDINDVMLATSLNPEGFLVLG